MDYRQGIVDAHFHLWKPERLNYPWLQTFDSVNRSYSIDDYCKETHGKVIDKIVFIQCECISEQFIQEIELITEIAKTDVRVQGIVCWFPLERANVFWCPQLLTDVQQTEFL